MSRRSMKMLTLGICTALFISIFTVWYGMSSTVAETNGIHIFVSLSGDDSGSGAIDKPFRSLERARDEAEILMNQSSEPITINIREGEYILENQIYLGHSNSGTPSAPITWQAYNGEKVQLFGGVKITPDQIIPVTDPAMLSRVTDEQAASKLLSINISDYFKPIPPPMIEGTPGDVTIKQPILVINGKSLTPARWPNNEKDTAYFQATDMKILGADHNTSPFQFSFNGAASKLASWSQESLKDLYIQGFPTYDWANAVLKVASVHAGNGTVTSTSGYWAEPVDGARFSFFNLPEEIDMPGESYIDREKGIVYFYPPCDMTNADVYLPVLEQPIFYLYQAEYVQFRGLEMGYTHDPAFFANEVKGIIVDGCTITHTANTGLIMDTAEDCIVRNCHIYDTESGGIAIWGANWDSSLESNGNIIENNRIHTNFRTYRWSGLSILVHDSGVTIQNNKIYDAPVGLLGGSFPNSVIQYNDLSDAVHDLGDAGAIYYGGSPTQAGVEIRNNYFHDIGNVYNSYGQQSIFCDEGTAVAHIYGNIFYNGSNQTPEHGAAIKTNGGQYGLVENNIIVNSPIAASFEPWSIDFDETVNPLGKQDRWLLWCFDLMQMYGDDYTIWKYLTEDYEFLDAKWEDHFKGTQWEPLWTYLSKENYDEAQQLGRDTTELYQFAMDNAPGMTNTVRDNVVINITPYSPATPIYQGNYNEEGTTYHTGSAILSNGSPMFKNFGTDFALTSAGLDEIRKTIPGFDNIPSDKIGLKIYTADGRTLLPGGQSPSASNVSIALQGKYASATWNYADPGKVLEGVSEINWFVSDTQNGVFTKIPGKHDYELLLDASYLGKYLRFEIIPYNRNMIHGEAAISAGLLVSDVSDSQGSGSAEPGTPGSDSSGTETPGSGSSGSGAANGDSNSTGSETQNSGSTGSGSGSNGSGSSGSSSSGSGSGANPESPEAAAPDAVTAFTTRLYDGVFQRKPDPEGLAYWVNGFTSKNITASQAAYFFFTSPEMGNLKLSDGIYIERLYTVMMGRASDAEGKTYWTGFLDKGMSRMGIVRQFLGSQEFKNICSTAGIDLGIIPPASEARDVSPYLTVFLFRQYQVVLGRSVDIGSLNYWAGKYLYEGANLSDISRELFFSEEIVSKKWSNEVFLSSLYRTFFDREPEADGYAYWLNEMHGGMKRERVLDSFAYSWEFDEVIKGFNLQ